MSERVGHLLNKALQTLEPRERDDCCTAFYSDNSASAGRSPRASGFR